MAAKAELRAFLGINSKQFEQGLARARAKANDFAKKGMMAAGAAVVTFGAALAAGSRKTLTLGADLDHLRAQTGVAIKDLMVFQRALKDNGVSADSARKALNKMQKSIVEAGEGLSTPLRALDRIGLSVEQLENLSPSEQFNMIAAAISRVEDPAVRAATAMDIFGRSGAEMAGVFKEGALEDAAASLGKMPELMDQFGAAMERADTIISGLGDKTNQFMTGFTAEVVGSILGPLEEANKMDFTTLGQRLGAAIAPWIEAIKGGEAWELFSLHATKAVMKFGAMIIDGFGNAAITIGALLWGTFKAAGQILKNVFLESAASLAEALAKIEPPEWVKEIPGIGPLIEKGLNAAATKARSVAESIRAGQEDAKSPQMLVHETIANAPELKLREGVDEMFDPAIDSLNKKLEDRAQENRDRAAAMASTAETTGERSQAESIADRLLNRETAFDSMMPGGEKSIQEIDPQQQERNRLLAIVRKDFGGRTVEGRKARQQLVKEGVLSSHRGDQMRQLNAIKQVDKAAADPKQEGEKTKSLMQQLVEEVAAINQRFAEVFPA